MHVNKMLVALAPKMARIACRWPVLMAPITSSPQRWTEPSR